MVGLGASRGPDRMLRGREAGQAILLALLVLVLVSIALSIIAGALAVKQKAIVDEVREVELRALTDAALARTLAELKRKRSYRGLPEENFGPGKIMSKVEPVSGTQVRVVVVATYGERKKAIEAEVELPLKKPPEVLSWQRAVVPEED